MKILMLIGSLRAESWTAELTGRAAGLLPPGVASQAYDDLAGLPHYDQDLDTHQPPLPVAHLREAVAAADALVVATPEYNGSIPGVLKNAIDWLSRPRGGAAITGKPVAVLSVSPSPRGAQWAREDAVRVLRVAGAVPLEESVGIAEVHTTVVDGHLAAGTEEALSDLMTNLVEAADATPTVRPAA